MKHIFIEIIFCLIFFFPSNAQDTIRFEWEHNNRFCVVYVPSSQIGKTGLPVVLNLHGYGGDVKEQINYTKLHVLGDSVGFITVYPQAYDLIWNSGIGDNSAWPTSNTDDVGFISLVIDSLITRYKIDTQRIFSCGFSNGGFMSFKLAGQLSHRIAAIASVGGVITKSTADTYIAKHAVPMLLIHGTTDRTVPFYGGVDGWYSAEKTIEFWRFKNNCLLPAESLKVVDSDPNDQSTVMRYTYHSAISANTSTVVLLKVLNGGHTWPGAQQYAGYVTNNDIKANDEIWNFFKQYKTKIAEARITSDVSDVDFNPLEIGQTSDTVIIHFKSTGRSSLTIESITAPSSPFFITNLPTIPISISSNESLPLKVVFKAIFKNLLSDTIRIVCNDSLCPQMKISLRGRGVSIEPAVAGVLYASQFGVVDGSFYKIGISNVVSTPIGLFGVSGIRALAIQPSSKKVYGISSNPISTSLYRISVDSGYAAFVKSIAAVNMNAIAFNSGDTLYGATSTGQLYRVNFSSGEVVLIGTTAGLSYWGLTFSPSGKLFASARRENDSIYIVNTSTGIARAVNETGIFAIPRSLACNAKGVLYCLFDDGSGGNYLGTLDTLTGVGTLISENPMSANNLSAIAMRSDVVNSIPQEQNTQHPTTFSLEQNYPNPFNPTTMISYQLPVSSQVSIKIYDLLGREIATLVNEEQSAGWKEVQWNASNYASGIYLVRMQAGNYSDTKKVLLIK